MFSSNPYMEFLWIIGLFGEFYFTEISYILSFSLCPSFDSSFSYECYYFIDIFSFIDNLRAMISSFKSFLSNIQDETYEMGSDESKSMRSPEEGTNSSY